MVDSADVKGKRLEDGQVLVGGSNEACGVWNTFKVPLPALALQDSVERCVLAFQPRILMLRTSTFDGTSCHVDRMEELEIDYPEVSKSTTHVVVDA